MSQWKSFLVVALFLVGSGLSGVADADEESRTYPNDWTHRPLVEHFGSLSAVYDMAYAAPAINQLVEDSENDPSNPYNIISFHQTNGGNGDDSFHTKDSKFRMSNHYGQNGVPNVQFDGNYRYVGGGGESNYQDYVEAIKDSGPRAGEGNDEPFKIVDLDIYCEFGESEDVGQFEITVDILYLDDGDDPDILGESSDLNGELFVFMVEDGVPAYSSYLDAIWNNRMVFREYAIDDEEFTLEEGESTTFSAVWKVPTTQTDGDGITGDIKIPINPGRMIPIAVVFDRDDTDSGNDQDGDGDGDEGEDEDDSDGDDTYPTPRSIQSATPKSTAYDNSLEVSSVSSIQININYEDRVGIGVTFSDNIAISSAYVIYNFDDGELSFASMSLDNNNQNGNVFVDIEGELLSYRIVSFNSDNVFNASSLYSYAIQYLDYSVSSPISHDICNTAEINFTAVNNGNFMDTMQVRITNLQELEAAGFVFALAAQQYLIDSQGEQPVRITVNSTGVEDTKTDYPLTLNVSTTLQGWDVSAENTTIMKFTDCQEEKETVDKDDSQKDKDNSTSSDEGGPYEGDDAGECSDEADNDRNGLFDCDDEGCSGSPACKASDPTEDSRLPSLSLLAVVAMLGIISILRRK